MLRWRPDRYRVDRRWVAGRPSRRCRKRSAHEVAGWDRTRSRNPLYILAIREDQADGLPASFCNEDRRCMRKRSCRKPSEDRHPSTLAALPALARRFGALRQRRLLDDAHELHRTIGLPDVVGAPMTTELMGSVAHSSPHFFFNRFDFSLRGRFSQFLRRYHGVPRGRVIV